MKNRISLVLAILCMAASIFCFMGCAPQQNNQSLNNGEDQKGVSTGVKITWSIDTDCAQCHIVETSSIAESTNCLAQVHSELGYTCTNCHTDESALMDVHEHAKSGSPASTLKKTEVPRQTCLSCHGSLEEVARSTTDVEVSDDTGTTTNPHALPASKDHDAIECADCHVSHTTSDARQEAEGTCASCHHAGVFECGTCHT